MKLEFVEDLAVVGKKIDLTTQEIRVIKEKWEEVVNPKGGNTVRVNKDALKDFDCLMEKLFLGVPSDSDVHAILFSKADEEFSRGKIDLPLNRIEVE